MLRLSVTIRDDRARATAHPASRTRAATYAWHWRKERIMSVPGWPSIHDPEEIGPPPEDRYPGCISDFDKELSHFRSLCDEARGEILRIDDCVKHERAAIREHKAYISRVNTEIARTQAEITKKQADDRPETEIARLVRTIEEMGRNIANAGERIAESNEAIGTATALRDPWRKEWTGRKAIWSTLNNERRKGLDKQGQPRLCRKPNRSDGSPCANEKHFRYGIGWGDCYQHP
jgi:hypothetical protein